MPLYVTHIYLNDGKYLREAALQLHSGPHLS
jgi:hypothetical protein